MKTALSKESIGLHPTSVTSRLGWVLRALGRLFFCKVKFDDANAEIVRRATRRGTVVYLMRDRSYIDYLYFNWAYLTRHLPAAVFIGGLGSFMVYPWRVFRRWILRRAPLPDRRPALDAGRRRVHPAAPGRGHRRAEGRARR